MKLALLSEIGGLGSGHATAQQATTTERIVSTASARQSAFNRFNRQMTQDPTSLAHALGALLTEQEVAADDSRQTSVEIISEVLAKSNGGSHLGIGLANVDPDTASTETRVRANEQAWSIIWGLPNLRAKRHALHSTPEGPDRDAVRRALSLETLRAVVLFNMQEDGLAPLAPPQLTGEIPVPVPSAAINRLRVRNRRRRGALPGGLSDTHSPDSATRSYRPALPGG